MGNDEFGLPDPRKDIMLVLADGEEYALSPLSVSGLRAVGKLAAGHEDESDQGMAFLTGLVWYALKANSPDMTLEQAGELIPAEWLQLGPEGLGKLLSALGIRAEIAAAEPDPTD